jgi:acyl dehydratase
MATTTAGRRFVDLYYEDVVVGERMATASHTVTMTDILAFADVTRDHHPLHTDPDYCRKTEIGRPIAHGLFGLSLVEGLKAETKMYENTSIASLGWDKVRFLKPVFPDDTLHVEVTFAAKRESRKPGRGVVIESVRLVNQAGEAVLEGEHTTLLKRRAAA